MDDSTRRELVVRFVEATGEAGPSCPVCRYGLAGLRGARCPECGTELTLALGAAESRLGFWVAGLLGWGVLGGFCFLILIETAWMYLFLDPVNRPDGWEIAAVVGLPLMGFAAGTGAVWGLVKPRGRRWIQGLRRSRAWAVAVVSAAAAPAFLGLLLVVSWCVR